MFKSRFKFFGSAVGIFVSGWYLSRKWNSREHPSCAINHSAIERDGLRNDPLTSKFTRKCRRIIESTMTEKGLPGLSVTVSVDGQTVFSEGFGYSDIENMVPCTGDTVMRLASISKTLTAVAVMQLVETGNINLDAPIQDYLPDYPQMTFDGEPVTMTTRQLMCHSSGIRSYHVTEGQSELTSREYFITDHYDTVLSSLELFCRDPLIFKPGTKYLYTTFGWTIISAIIESASGENFLSYMKDKIFLPLGMNSTVPEFNAPLINHRSRYYVRNADGALENTAYIDNSYKWAGGGFLSSTRDIIKFGNALLASYNYYQLMTTDTTDNNRSMANEQHIDDISRPKFFINPQTVKHMWDVAMETKKQGRGQRGYGLGWEVWENKSEFVGSCGPHVIIGHTGAAIGASSVITIIPTPVDLIIGCYGNHVLSARARDYPVSGIVVSMNCNLQEVNLRRTGNEIGILAFNEFYKIN